MDSANNAAPIRCTNGCGFYGNVQCEGMCSKCFRDELSRRNSIDQHKKEADEALDKASSILQQAAAMATPSTTPVATASASAAVASASAPAPVSAAAAAESASAKAAVPDVKMEDAEATACCESCPATATAAVAAVAEAPKKKKSKKRKQKKGRCFECNKKIPLAMRFKCKCDYVFCNLHRQPEVHKCSFDFKKEGREHLKKINSHVATFAKLEKL